MKVNEPKNCKSVGGYFYCLVLRIFKIKIIPYKGICAYCHKDVWHYYPWYTKNPQYNDAKPLHDKCADIYLFRT